MHQEFQDADSRKAALCHLYSAMLLDFDNRRGAFAELDYRSPWAIVTAELAERSGRSVNELREMITLDRLAAFSHQPRPEWLAEALNDFHNAVSEWKRRAGIVTTGTRLTIDDMTFPNRAEMKAHAWAEWQDVDLYNKFKEFDQDHLTFYGLFNDSLGHRVAVRLAIFLRYGGTIDFSLRFPYYGNDEPQVFHFSSLMAVTMRRQIGYPPVRELEWNVGKSKQDFLELDTVIEMIKAVMTYFRPVLN